jgi:hypothetical protein
MARILLKTNQNGFDGRDVSETYDEALALINDAMKQRKLAVLHAEGMPTAFNTDFIGYIVPDPSGSGVSNPEVPIDLSPTPVDAAALATSQPAQ